MIYSTGICDGLKQKAIKETATPRVVRKLDAICGAVVNRLDRICRGTASSIRQKLQRDNLCIPCNAGHTDTVVSLGSNRSRDVGSVTIAILWVVRVGNKVPTTDIIDVTIAVVVDAISSNLAWVHPNVALKVWMVEIDSRVDYRHPVVRISGVEIPCLRSIDVIELAGCIVHPPGTAEQWIVWRYLRRYQIVQSGTQYTWVS